MTALGLFTLAAAARRARLNMWATRLVAEKVSPLIRSREAATHELWNSRSWWAATSAQALAGHASGRPDLLLDADAHAQAVRNLLSR